MTLLTTQGSSVWNRHTHYEVHGHEGPIPVTLIISGEVAQAYHLRTGRQIEQAGRLQLTYEGITEAKLDPACRNPFRNSGARRGYVRAIDDLL